MADSFHAEQAQVGGEVNGEVRSAQIRPLTTTSQRKVLKSASQRLSPSGASDYLPLPAAAALV